MNLYDLFARQAEKQPDHPLIVLSDRSIRYGEFRRRIDDLATALGRQGVKAGDCIALHYPNGADYIALTYALWRCGACVVPLPTELGAPEKQAIFRHIRIDGFVSRTDLSADLQPAQAAEPRPLDDGIVFAPARIRRDHPPGFAGLNPAFLRFSSGTTGASKGVVLSHETIHRRIQAANDGLNLGPGDRIVWLLSMAYHFAVSIVAYLSYGCTLLLCPNAFGTTIVATAARHRATLTYGAPTHYALMTHDDSGTRLPDLRLAIVTTTALAPEVADAFRHRFQRPLNETYGIIEVGLPCINLGRPGDKQGSVGQVLPAYELRLQDPDPASGWGAIQVRGPGLLDAYYDPWQTRDQILQANGGWFATGDLGELDDEGYLRIRGRSTAVISVGGMKFFPEEVEAVLESHPAIRAACVFRRPNPRLGDEPWAQLVATPEAVELPDARALTAYCRRHLALHKVPVNFTFVAALLTTASGKRVRDPARLTAHGEVAA